MNSTINTNTENKSISSFNAAYDVHNNTNDNNQLFLINNVDDRNRNIPLLTNKNDNDDKQIDFCSLIRIKAENDRADKENIKETKSCCQTDSVSQCFVTALNLQPAHLTSSNGSYQNIKRQTTSISYLERKITRQQLRLMQNAFMTKSRIETNDKVTYKSYLHPTRQNKKRPVPKTTRNAVICRKINTPPQRQPPSSTLFVNKYQPETSGDRITQILQKFRCKCHQKGHETLPQTKPIIDHYHHQQQQQYHPQTERVKVLPVPHNQKKRKRRVTILSKHRIKSAQVRAYRHKQREQETPEEASERRAKQALKTREYRRRQREKESENEANERRAKQAKKTREYRKRQRAKETPLEAAERRAKQAARSREIRRRQRETETEAQAFERRAKLAARVRERRKLLRENETPVETAVRLAKQAARSRECRKRKREIESQIEAVQRRARQAAQRRQLRKIKRENESLEEAVDRRCRVASRQRLYRKKIQKKF